MGILAGFAPPGVQYHRIGFRANPDPNAVVGLPFLLDVTASNYEESWIDEIQVFHNPSALTPLGFEVLVGATNHYFKDGMLRSLTPAGAILSSYTIITQPYDADAPITE
jgi:hypothetical protein